MRSFVLVGNPNCGKTTLFNSLTGSNSHVGNWPGVTVETKIGLCKLGSEDVNVVDLPGIYSLSPYTNEEIIARNFIIENKPDCIINIVDSSNLERNLYLTTQLMEMDVPIVLALNMTDIVEKKGHKIDAKILEKSLGIKTIKITATKKGDNFRKLIDLAIEESKDKRLGKSVLVGTPVEHLIHDLSLAFRATNISDPLFHACKLAELDELEVKEHPNLVEVVNGFKASNVDESLENDLEAIIADSRYKFITSCCSNAVTKSNETYDKKQVKIDKVLTHKIWGIPIFLAILFLMFHFVFSTNFLFMGNLFNDDCFYWLKDNEVWNGFSNVFWQKGGFNSPGQIFTNVINGLTTALSNVIRGSFKPLVASNPGMEWLPQLVCDGILGGLFLLIGFLPQILLLFLFFSILEDSGYMSRVAFILDRIFKKFGLSGRSLLPMIMGFGCSVPAMVNTRTIADEKERIATIRVIPFFSCGAKLPILTAISGCLVSVFKLPNADVITLCMYILGIIVALLTATLMRKTSLRGDSSPFIMELPEYHIPQFKSTMLLVWDKAEHFIKKAFTVILASTIVIWFISHFGWNWAYLPADQMDKSILSNIGQFIKPIFAPTGFGIISYGWVFVVASICGLIAKENVIAALGTLTLSILTSVGYAGATPTNSMGIFIKLMSDETLGGACGLYDPFFAQYGTAILIAFIAFNMLTIPCIATVATARSELPKKYFGTTLLFWVITSFIVSSCIFTVCSWWWTSFIWLVLLAAIIIFVRLFNKKKQRIKLSI